MRYIAKIKKLKITGLSYASIFCLFGLALIGWRIGLMLIVALTDNTESRYAEIAQLTVSYGFWLMPHIYIDQAFFAKPPLSTWLAALSGQFLGVSEFSLRLPSLFAGSITLWAIWKWSQPLSKNNTARVFSLFAALACPLFFISIGNVMTDAIHMACVTLGLLCAYQTLYAFPDNAPLRSDACTSLVWRLGFWCACGLGMLSKGLATVALIGLPLFLFALTTKGAYKRLWQALWCWQGLFLAALICVPWYGLAEQAHPGFLNYFFIGEHWMRFTHAGWSGDQYGHAHRYPLGIIWPFWMLAILPWLAIFIQQAWLNLRPHKWKQVDEKQRFLWCACLAPLLFFTFTRNLILTYPLTAIPPFAALLAYWYSANCTNPRRLIKVSGLILVLAILSGSVFLPRLLENYSDRRLVQSFQTVAKPGQKLMYSGTAPYSAYFYSKQNIEVLDHPQTLKKALTTPDNFIALPLSEMPLITSTIGDQYHTIYKSNKNIVIKTLP